jgi:hypothetical protein
MENADHGLEAVGREGTGYTMNRCYTIPYPQ